MKRYQFRFKIYKWKEVLVDRVIEFIAETQEEAAQQASNYALGHFDAYHTLAEATGNSLKPLKKKEKAEA